MSSIKLYEGADASTPNAGLIVVYAKTDGKLAYKNDAGEEIVIGSGGGSGLLQLVPSNVSLDDTNVGSDGGNAWDIAETIDFSPSENGSIWATIHFPNTLDPSVDISLKIVYNLNGSDDSTNVRFQTEYWTYGSTETPSSSTPTGTNTDDISVGTGTDGQRLETTLSVIPNTALAESDTITFKFTRLSEDANDTYSGTFQMLYIFPYQTF